LSNIEEEHAENRNVSMNAKKTEIFFIINDI
jgi:hypothetical protein